MFDAPEPHTLIVAFEEVPGTFVDVTKALSHCPLRPDPCDHRVDRTGPSEPAGSRNEVGVIHANPSKFISLAHPSLGRRNGSCLLDANRTAHERLLVVRLCHVYPGPVDVTTR